MLREYVLAPALGAAAALPASGVTLSLLIILAASTAIRFIRPTDAAGCWIAGATWLAMTLVLEFGLVVAGTEPLRRAIADLLDPRDGNLMLLVLATTLAAPRLAARLRGIAGTP